MTEWLNLASPPWPNVPVCPCRTHGAAAAYLHPGLGQVDLHGQLLPGEHVRVVRLCEHRLQSLQLWRDGTPNIPRVSSFLSFFSFPKNLKLELKKTMTLD